MPSPSQIKALSLIESKLRPLVATLRPEPMHWVCGGGADPGLDFCKDCAERYAAAIKATSKEPDDVTVDGGWDIRRECDGHAACTTCGRTLGYSLTKYGFGSELEAFEACDFTAPLSNETGYAVDAICHAALFVDNPDDVRLAIKIGRAAVSVIR